MLTRREQLATYLVFRLLKQRRDVLSQIHDDDRIGIGRMSSQ